MVAPTPVSALLHSSTMVKAGVYLVVRLAPAFAGTGLGYFVALAGGFTFMAASAIAISQSNAKRVLAYSTIANLGLIICCAGVDNTVALAAAILLIIFHGVSKGFLFLCVGTVEQKIGSRNIEDMQGVLKIMPVTTIMMVIGMVSMFLPPFGVLITKWLAIEATVSMPLVLIMIVLGSACTVVFWSKWIGTVMTMSYRPKYIIENIHSSIKIALGLMFVGVVVTAVGTAPLFIALVNPHLQALNLAGTKLIGTQGGFWVAGNTGAAVGGFAELWAFVIGGILIFGVLLCILIYGVSRTRPATLRTPYLCGENLSEDIGGLVEFTGPGEKAVGVAVRNYYLTGAFGEERLTLVFNLFAGALILLMIGVVIK
jgi:ech hydrogenase subunit A